MVPDSLPPSLIQAFWANSLAPGSHKGEEGPIKEKRVPLSGQGNLLAQVSIGKLSELGIWRL